MIYPTYKNQKRIKLWSIQRIKINSKNDLKLILKKNMSDPCQSTLHEDGKMQILILDEEEKMPILKLIEAAIMLK